jgi:hypothetical protein
MRVVGDSSSARWGSEEMGEELGFWVKREWEDRKDGNRQGRGGDDSDGSFSNGQQEILYGDISKQNMLDNFFELKVDIGVLVLGGQGILKLRAYYISLLDGNVSEDMEEVGWGYDRGQGQRAVGIKTWGEAITTRAGVVSGVVRTVEVVLDNLVGGSNIDLVNIVNL